MELLPVISEILRSVVLGISWLEVHMSPGQPRSISEVSGPWEQASYSRLHAMWEGYFSPGHLGLLAPPPLAPSRSGDLPRNCRRGGLGVGHLLGTSSPRHSKDKGTHLPGCRAPSPRKQGHRSHSTCPGGQGGAWDLTWEHGHHVTEW